MDLALLLFEFDATKSFVFGHWNKGRSIYPPRKWADNMTITQAYAFLHYNVSMAKFEHYSLTMFGKTNST